MRTAEEARLQSRHELEARCGLDLQNMPRSWVRCTWQNRTLGRIFLPGLSAKLGSAFRELPGAVVDLRYGGPGPSAAGRQECGRTLHAERPEFGDWIAAEYMALALGQRTNEKRVKHLNFCCGRPSMANRARSATSMGSFLVGTWDCLKAVRELLGVGRDQRWHGSVER